MTVEALTFEIGGFPSVELQLASSEGLAPLTLPSQLPTRQPSPEAVRLFQAAMAEGESAPTQVKGWAGLETVEIVPVQSENLVNPVKEDVPVQPIEVNSDGLKKELHYRSAPRVAPESRLSNDVSHTIENPAHPVQTEVSAQPIERQLESGFIAHRAGEVVAEPTFSTVGVETTPQPRTIENPVNPVKEDIPVQPIEVNSDGLKKELHYRSAPRIAPESRLSNDVLHTIENPAHPVQTEVPAQPIERQLESGFVARRAGEVVAEPAFSTVGVEPTPQPRTIENPAHPVKEDVSVQPIEVNSDGLKKELHYRSAPRVAPESRLSNDVLHTIENPAHPVQTEAPAQPIERQLESGFVARREGEGMTEPAFSTVGVETTPPPRTIENPVNLVKEDIPVRTIEVNSDGLKKELHYRSAPRIAPESRLSNDVLRTVENPAHPVQTEVPAQPIERQLESGLVARREGEGMTESAFSTVGVEPTRQPRTVEAPVEKNVAPQVRARSEHPVDEPDAPTVLAAAPMMSPPLVERTIPAESAAVQQVAAAQSARTEAVNAAVARAVETVNALVETVVAEIAITPALARGDGEIRITLKPTVLDGSALHLSAKAGELTVSIAPATAEAAHVIQQNLPRLETALAEHTPAFRHVAVVLSSFKKGKTDETA